MSLNAHGVSAAFGGIVALNEVAVTVLPGKVTAVIGPNGAGKSTLINCLTGMVEPTSGRIEVDGRDITGISAHRRVHHGITRSYQTPRVDPDGSVLEAVLVGLYSQSTSGLFASILRTPRFRREEARNHAVALAMLERFGMRDLADVTVSDLPLWQLRMLEVARSMAAAPTYLLLDEPAAGLDEREQEVLAAAIQQVTGEGAGVLLIEHNFGFVRSLADQVVVLHMGEMLAEGTMAEIEKNPDVISIYLGASA